MATGRVPRAGFFHDSQQAAFLGRGPTYKHSDRLAYGPGPGGSFKANCDTAWYDQIDLAVFKERSTYFYLPKRKPFPLWRPPLPLPAPAWAERLSLTKGQLVQLQRSGSVPGRLVRPGSAPALVAPPSPKEKLVLSCGGAYKYTPPARNYARPNKSPKKKEPGRETPVAEVASKDLPDSPSGVVTSATFEKVEAIEKLDESSLPAANNAAAAESKEAAPTDSAAIDGAPPGADTEKESALISEGDAQKEP